MYVFFQIASKYVYNINKFCSGFWPVQQKPVQVRRQMYATIKIWLDCNEHFYASGWPSRGRSWGRPTGRMNKRNRHLACQWRRTFGLALVLIFYFEFQKFLWQRDKAISWSKDFIFLPPHLKLILENFSTQAASKKRIKSPTRQSA